MKKWRMTVGSRLMAWLLAALLCLFVPIGALAEQGAGDSVPAVEESNFSVPGQEPQEASPSGAEEAAPAGVEEPSSGAGAGETASLPEEMQEQWHSNAAETFASSNLLITGGHNAYMHGYPDGSFQPNRAMTRAEVAMMFYNLLAAKPAVSSSAFSDVPLNAWYGRAVNTLAKSGVIDGYSDGSFLPNKNITRAQFVKIAALCFPLQDGAVSYSDVAEENWAYQYIVSASVSGWIGGYSDGSFRPNQPIKRCEAAKIMNEALGRTGEGFAADKGIQKFFDVPESHWAYEHITEAAEPDEEEKPGPDPVNSGYVRVTATGLNLRKGPSTDYESLTVLPMGTVLTVLDRDYGSWIHVKTSGGQEGYVAAEYVQEYDPSAASSVSLSTSSATVQQYKTLYLTGTVSPASTAMEWRTSDESVATVSKGFVYAKAPGTAVITYTDFLGKSKASCTVKVTAPEAVRAAYTEPNTVTAGKPFEMIAVTDSGKTGVKFTITAGGKGTYETTEYTTESQSASGLPTNTVRIFKRQVTFEIPGSYTVRAYSRTGSGGYSEGYQEFTVLVVSNYNVNTTTYDTRMVSTEMIDIIAHIEGYEPTVYPDKLAGNIPTVGYGYVVSKNETFYNNITRSEAKALMAKDINSGGYASAVNQFRSRYNLKMSQCQFDALVSFVYNLGPGPLLDRNGDEPYYGTARVLANAVSPPSSFPVSGTVNVNDSVVYASASTSSKKVGTIDIGSSLSVLAVKTNVNNNKEVWYQVQYGSVKGWARAGNIRLSGTQMHDLAYVDSITFGNNLTQWNMADGVHIEGLFDRRMAEARLFSYGDYAGCYRGSEGYSRNPGYTIPSWYP